MQTRLTRIVEVDVSRMADWFLTYNKFPESYSNQDIYDYIIDNQGDILENYLSYRAYKFNDFEICDVDILKKELSEYLNCEAL